MINLTTNFTTNVQKGFIKLQKKNPKKYMKIDSNLDINITKKLFR